MNGAEYLVWYTSGSGTWQTRYVSSTGVNSNRPSIIVEDNILKLKTEHANNYTVRMIAEDFNAGVAVVMPDFLGASNQWQKMGSTLSYSDGNVGIGTPDPKAKLAVNGNILAKEIKVKTDITVPDYVFDADYKLRSLTEVEAYVKEHKHLPEIPSAKEISEDGLDLARMNLLLLKKVEELTLQLIDLKKENEQIKKHIGYPL